MPLLFSYGTLRDQKVQLSLFGRTLAGHNDDLLGFEQALVRVENAEFARTSGKTHHAILRRASDAGARVPGTALQVTDGELEIADSYEPVEYRRVLAGLASGQQTWVYVDAGVTDRET